MRIAAWLMAAALAFTTACSGTASVKEAEAKVAIFHQNLDSEKYEAIWNDSSEEITGTEGKEKLVGLLGAIHARFGKVKATKQTGWKVNVNNGVHSTEVTMTTTYEKGSLEEHFVFKGTDNGLKLAGYQFDQK